MRKHFMAVLGTGRYSECEYVFEGKGVITPYIQIGVLEMCVGKITKEDRISIFITEKAKESNWIGEGKLEELLQEKYPDINIEAVPIVEGRTPEELDTLFDSIYNQISENEEVYFDITHGLRNIPMQVLAILNYARVLKNIKIAGIYYGAYELKTKEEGDMFFKSPVFDLKKYSDTLNWTSAAEAFVNTGNCKMMKNLHNEKSRQIQKMWAVETNAEKKKMLETERDEYKKIGKVLEGLNDLTSCLNTGRGKNFPDLKGKNAQCSIKGAYQEFADGMKDIDKDDLDKIKQLKPLFQKVQEDIAEFEKAKTDGEVGIAAAKWALDKKLTQQGYTALEETIKTVVCEEYGIPAENEHGRDRIVGSCIKTFAAKIGEFKGDREKIYEEWRTNYTRGLSDESIEKGKEIIFTISKKYAQLAYNVSQVRNNMNHIGFQNDSRSYMKLEDSYKKHYEEFKSFENVREEE